MPPIITASYKQRKLVNKYLQHGDLGLAGQEAYGAKTKELGYGLAHTALQQPTTKVYLARMLEKAGLTEDKIANGIKLIMEASLTKDSLKQATPTHGLKALELGAKLLNMMPAERKEIKKMSLSLEAKSEEELVVMLERIESEARNFRKMVKNTNTINENLP
jgi:hypothetical protein